MNQPASPAPTNSRRLITVVLLGGVVIAALLLTEEEEPSRVAKLAPPEALATANAGRSQSAREIQWPEMSLTVIQARDPFRLPMPATPVAEVISPPHPPEDNPAEPTPAETVRVLEARRVSAILRTRTGTAALIDGKIYRTGDYLHERIRIIAISESGVTVQYEAAAAETSDQNL